ncbi:MULTISPECIES: DUF6587 family protein [Pseudoxanthomonas]|uniref:Uncharacterized protein n=1 Tax=Pseudoxanthomonas taiwanensis J19 TaxID=935569 RepID=A0A562DH83_9GAMM|nr:MULTISPECIES: DUF6587 family protein [Pseudoxanthomonas]TWH08990.1 hypothetical protein L613_004200000040 [Pseudoxanthomonas taiwanensis J19]
MPLWLQYVIVALVVLLALWMFLRRQFPGTVRRLRLALAAPLVRDGRPAWMRRLARLIAPAAGGGAGACGGCDACGPEPRKGPPR